jgi:hypothetical protein
MKIRSLTAMFTLVLLIAPSLTTAACLPNDCAQRYDACIQSGTRLRTCESQYVQCLNRYGCPIP